MGHLRFVVREVPSEESLALPLPPGQITLLHGYPVPRFIHDKNKGTSGCNFQRF